MAEMTTEAFEIRFKFNDKMVKAAVTRFINKSHKIVPDFRVYYKEPAPREREHVFTFYTTKDIYEPIFWFPLHNRVKRPWLNPLRIYWRSGSWIWVCIKRIIMNGMRSIRLAGVLLLLAATGVLFYSMEVPLNKYLVAGAYVAVGVGVWLVSRPRRA